MRKAVKILLATVSAMALFGYIFFQYKQNNAKKIGSIREHRPLNFLFIDSCEKLLKHGDIVFRRGADAISDLFVSMNQANKSYSHCGIYLKTKDSGFIYHSIGGEDNPDAKIQKEYFKNFVHPKINNAFGVCRINFSDTQKNSLDSIIKLWYTQEKTFDMDFDLNSDDKLYCVEFIAKAIQLAVHDPNYFHKSFVPVKNLEYYAPDDVYLNKNVTKVFERKFQ